MNKTMVLASALLLMSSLASAKSPDGTAPVEVQANQAVIQVNGIVCSFCAYGTEKNLSKLTFLDKSQFGNNGVLIDIETHRVTLALLPDQQLNLPEVYRAIKKGGYDPVTFYVNLRGEVQKSGDRYLLTCSDNGQVFDISGSEAGRLVGQGVVRVHGKVDAEVVSTVQAGQPIPIVVATDGVHR